ncbi:MAG: alkaline phosphatase family protein [Xanthobacteraceae bacterium]|nr:alkaline phosphatase family protein [Xanthobacteraceae bacterium]
MSDDKSILLDTSGGLGQQGYAWTIEIPASFGPGDNLDALTSSRLVVYEDDRELGPSHASHETIRQAGGGAYSHWNNTLYFSTSDRSDPRTNGRRYRIALGSLKVLVIGVDGTDPQMLRRYIVEGRLPAITRILEQSREVEVRTEGELFINAAWTCFASGLSVGSHGVHAFRPLRSGTMEFAVRSEYRVPTPFWNFTARAGIRTCVLDGPFYPPPAAEHGLEKLTYVEWGPHPPARPPSSSPPDLIDYLSSRHGSHPCTIDIQVLDTIQDSADMAALLCAGARKRAAITKDLIRIANPELLVVHFPELHTATHQWLNSETPGHRRYDAALVKALGSPIRQVYEAVDQAIGRIIAQLSPDTTVVLTCLGGVRVTHGGAYLLDHLLHRLGLSVPPTPGEPASWQRYPEPVRRVLRFCRDAWDRRLPSENPRLLNIDWSKTRAFALPWAYDGYLRINQRGREPRGVVADGAEREQVLAEVESAVRGLRLAGTDEPAAKAVVRTQDAFPGAASAELPDLMVLWNNARPFDAVESEQLGRIENGDPAGRCAHNDLGGLFAYGPLIAYGPTIAGARDYDIAPTILEMLGVKSPERLDGHAISELIASASTGRDVRNTSAPLAAE